MFTGTAGSSALSTWSIQSACCSQAPVSHRPKLVVVTDNWGANGCCSGNGQAGCCGSCCDKCFNEDDFDEQTKKDAKTTDQQMQGAQPMSVPAASEPTVATPDPSKEAEA